MASDFGRAMQVKLSEENIVTGKLEAVEDTGIILLKDGDKKKKTAPETLKLTFDQIVESKVIISFK